jgi:hypothetical protein
VQIKREEEAVKFIFVHVPKTGGTSFIKNLDSRYRHITCRDYGKKRGLKDNDINKRGFERCNIIYGHFLSDKYKHLKRPQISIIREPTERVISEYFYRPNNIKAKSIVEYLENKKRHAGPRIVYDNVIYEYIKDIRRFAFIGITEQFDESIRRINKALKIEIPNKRFYSKKNPHKKRISKEERDFIKEFCKKDYEIYNAVLKRWWRR